MIYHLHQYITIEEYAKLCGVKTYTVFKRAKNKRATLFKIGKKRFVNIAINPIVKNFHQRTKRIPKKLPVDLAEKLESASTLPTPNLTAIKDIAAKHNIRTDSIYELVIGNKLDAWHIGGVTFVQENVYDELIKSLKTGEHNPTLPQKTLNTIV